MVLIIIVIAGVVLLAILLLIALRAGFLSFPWLQFYIKGKESDFALREINLLRRVAISTGIKDPTSLFWSDRTLDKCLGRVVADLKRRNAMESMSEGRFVRQLFELRKRIDSTVKQYAGIQRTREISAGQSLAITLPSVGTYRSRVVENNRRHIAVIYPEGGVPLPPKMEWKQQHVAVRFWRSEDAEYNFTTTVVGDYHEQEYRLLHIDHSKKLNRIQNRKSSRVPLNRPATIYNLAVPTDGSEKFRRIGGYRCRLLNISEGGAALLIGGKIRVGQPVQFQCDIDGVQVVMRGAIKGEQFRTGQNVTIAHVEARRPSLIMHNRIQMVVFGIVPSGSVPTAPKK